VLGGALQSVLSSPMPCRTLLWPVVCFFLRYVPSCAVLGWFIFRASSSFEDLDHVMTERTTAWCNACAFTLYAITVLVSFGFKPVVRCWTDLRCPLSRAGYAQQRAA